MLSTVAVLAALSTRPFLDNARFRFELLGEATVLGVLDCLVISSNPAVEPEMRWILGWFIISIVGILVLLTQLYVSILNCAAIRH